MTNCTCHMNIMSSISYGFTMTTYGLNDKHGFTCVVWFFEYQLYIIAHVSGCHGDKRCFFVKKRTDHFMELSIPIHWCQWCCQKLETQTIVSHEPIPWPLFWPGYFFVSVRSWPILQQSPRLNMGSTFSKLLNLEPLMAERQTDLLSSNGYLVEICHQTWLERTSPSKNWGGCPFPTQDSLKIKGD